MEKHGIPRIFKVTVIECRTGVTKATGGVKGVIFNGYKVSVWDEEKVLVVYGGDGCTIV